MSLKIGSFFTAIMAGVLMLGLLAVPVQAQESPDNPNVLVYQPDFFALYNPVTALDMVRQVPGFSIQDGGRARGFGSTSGNVLIDGERPSTKSTSLSDILQRLPVARVERVELVRGSMPGLDMRGLNRVVNVILVEGSSKSQTSWSFRATDFGKIIIPTGELIQSFKLAGADVSIGLQRNGGAPRSTEIKNFADANGDFFERRDARNQRLFLEWQPHLTVARKFANGDRLNLNAKYFNFTFTANRISETQVPNAGNLVFDQFDFADRSNAGNGAEIGGDYERKLGENRSLKLIVFQRSDVRFGGDLFETFDTGGFAGATRIRTLTANNESILRSVLKWQHNPKNSFEASIEGAYNWLKSGLDIETNQGTGFVPLILPVANTKVIENRAEAAVSWVAKPVTGWTFDSGLKYEISRISQSGDAINAQVFKFLKPNLNITWDRNKRDQIRLSFQRVVGQLNFSDFATSVNIIDNQTNVGNVQLRPDSTWSADFAFERKYGEKGVLILKGNHSWISDVRDLVPINNQFDAPGNIGSGRTWTTSIEARIPTDKYGVKDGILTISGGVGDSRVTDPLTGLPRVQSFRVDDFFSTNFRQDITKWKIAWGFSYFKRTALRAAFLFDQRVDTENRGNLGAFIETTKWKGMTLNLSARNLLDNQNQRIRTNFTGPRNISPIRDIETRTTQNGRVFVLSLRGTF
ncbi:hypothetical protein MNBD_ALPHA06-1751 [hydrothermal vent metagenome]|uniref:TonB-dependent receptor plug domain-containing protein n=1 Tax=hydrothermal vent metagenome TaxID=652676 RepID=A0A3B0RZ96_9ZZZZ